MVEGGERTFTAALALAAFRKDFVVHVAAGALRLLRSIANRNGRAEVRRNASDEARDFFLVFGAHDGLCGHDRAPWSSSADISCASVQRRSYERSKILSTRRSACACAVLSALPSRRRTKTLRGSWRVFMARPRLPSAAA